MAARSYKTPDAYRRALTAVFKSKVPGENVTPYLRSFYFQRLTAAVFADDPSGWLLKGGQALLTRYQGQARLSRDIDLQHVSRNLESAVAAVERAAHREMGDFFSFTLVKKEFKRERDLAEATFEVYIGNRVVSQIQVDIVVGRTCVGAPEIVSLEPVVDMLESPWPDVRLYPLADHVADKICAMYEWRNGNASGRYRDLADLLLISQQDRLNGHEAKRALASERMRRTSLGTDLRLPAEFQTPGPAWPINYPQQAAEIRGLQGCKTWDSAKAAAEVFLTPILDGSELKMWFPRDAAWT